MCDCEVKFVGKLGKPRPSRAYLFKGNCVDHIILSFENDINAASFFFGEHHTPQEVADALRRAAEEIEAKDSGRKPLSPKRDFFFHNS
jgi:hypothetical protein